MYVYERYRMGYSECRVWRVDFAQSIYVNTLDNIYVLSLLSFSLSNNLYASLCVLQLAIDDNDDDRIYYDVYNNN